MLSLWIIWCLRFFFSCVTRNTHLLLCSLLLVTRPPRGLSGKEFTCRCRRCRRHRFDPWVGKISWRRKWHPAPVCLPGKSDGQRSHVAAVHGVAESDTTAPEHVLTTYKLSIICSILRLFGVNFDSVESLQVPAETEDDFQSFPKWPLIFYVLYPFPENSAK